MISGGTVVSHPLAERCPSTATVCCEDRTERHFARDVRESTRLCPPAQIRLLGRRQQRTTAPKLRPSSPFAHPAKGPELHRVFVSLPWGGSAGRPRGALALLGSAGGFGRPSADPSPLPLTGRGPAYSVVLSGGSLYRSNPLSRHGPRAPTRVSVCAIRGRQELVDWCGESSTKAGGPISSLSSRRGASRRRSRFWPRYERRGSKNVLYSNPAASRRADESRLHRYALEENFHYRYRAAWVNCGHCGIPAMLKVVSAASWAVASDRDVKCAR